MASARARRIRRHARKARKLAAREQQKLQMKIVEATKK